MPATPVPPETPLPDLPKHPRLYTKGHLSSHPLGQVSLGAAVTHPLGETCPSGHSGAPAHMVRPKCQEGGVTTQTGALSQGAWDSELEGEGQGTPSPTSQVLPEPHGEAGGIRGRSLPGHQHQTCSACADDTPQGYASDPRAHLALLSPRPARSSPRRMPASSAPHAPQSPGNRVSPSMCSEPRAPPCCLVWEPPSTAGAQLQPSPSGPSALPRQDRGVQGL